MNKSVVSIVLALEFLTVLINGCAPAVPSTPILPPLTTSPIQPTISPELISAQTSISSTISPQVRAIEIIRTALELPESSLTFVEKTGMMNSPSGDLEVDNYQDDDGRIYSVNPEKNQVVEIDARNLLKSIPLDAQTFPMEVLKSKAMKYINATIPDFEYQQSSWKYDEGVKGGYYFFSWYGVMTPGSMNRPFAQIGLDRSGLLFAYYNTLLLNK